MPVRGADDHRGGRWRKSRSTISFACWVYLPLEGLPLSVLRLQELRRAPSPLPGEVVVSSSTASRAQPSRPAALSRGASLNPTSSDVIVPSRRSSPAASMQRLQPDRRLRADPFQSVPDEDAVLVAERHHVRDQPQRRQTDRVEQELAAVRGGLAREPPLRCATAHAELEAPRRPRTARRTGRRCRAVAGERPPRPRAGAARRARPSSRGGR